MPAANRIKPLLLLLTAALLSGAGAGAWAQVAPGSKAQISTVPVSGEVGRFRVPQVQLPNAAVARRINRQLLTYVTEQFSTIDSMGRPSRQLYQAARECCYHEDLRLWAAAGSGFTGTEYRVLLNQDFLLSVEFQDSFNGLEQPGTRHRTFDLRTGRLLTLPDLVADSPAQLQRRLGAAISHRLRDELAQVAANYGDYETIDRVARLYGISAPWNVTPARGMAEDLAPAAGDVILLGQEFALTPQALLLFHSVGMSRLEFEFLPDERYTFPFERLQPRLLLQPLLKSNGRGKVK